MDKIPVFLMTKEMPGREKVVFRTIAALQSRFRGPHGAFEWFIADGGSSENYLNAMREMIISPDVHIYSNGDESPGKVWSKSLEQLFSFGYEYYLRLEDDFELNMDMNVEHYIDLLKHKHTVGMIRLGLMPINLEMKSVGIGGEIYFDIQHRTQYSYSGNPGLVHKRLHDAVGLFHETHNPGDIELDFDSRIRHLGNLRILWPLLMGRYGTYGAWSHIGDTQSY